MRKKPRCEEANSQYMGNNETAICILPILDIPRHCENTQDGTDICATPIVDVARKPQAQVITEADAVRADVGPHHGERPAQAREELRGAVVPQLRDLERVPRHLAVDDLAGGRHGRPQHAAHGDEDEQADGLGPEDVPGGGGVPREVGHVQGEGGLGANGGRHALEEYDDGGRAVGDLRGLGEGWAEALGYKGELSVSDRRLIGPREEARAHSPATRAHMNKVSPNIGMMIVLAMNRYRSLLTCSQRRGSWTRMNKKKHNSCALVTWALSGRWLGKSLNCGQMAEIMTSRHWPPWKDCVPNQMHATTPRMNTAKYDPRMPKEARVRTGKLMPRMQPT